MEGVKLMKTNLIKAIVPVCLVLMSANAASQTIKTTAGQPIDGIVALVEEDVILRSELDLAIAGIVERIRTSGGTMPPTNLLERQVLESLITRELQVQRALQTGIRISDADKRTYERINRIEAG